MGNIVENIACSHPFSIRSRIHVSKMSVPLTDGPTGWLNDWRSDWLTNWVPLVCMGDPRSCCFRWVCVNESYNRVGLCDIWHRIPFKFSTWPLERCHYVCVAIFRSSFDYRLLFVLLLPHLLSARTQRGQRKRKPNTGSLRYRCVCGWQN